MPVAAPRSHAWAGLGPLYHHDPHAPEPIAFEPSRVPPRWRTDGEAYRPARSADRACQARCRKASIAAQVLGRTEAESQNETTDQIESIPDGPW